MCLWNTGFCLSTILFTNVYMYVRKLYHGNSYFKGCLDHCLRTPGWFSSDLSIQVFLQRRKDSVWQAQGQDFQKEQRQLVTCLEWLRCWLCTSPVTADPSPTPLEGVLLTEVATFLASRSLVCCDEIITFSTSADLVPWHRKNLQKGKSELGCNQSNNYLVRTCYVQSNQSNNHLVRIYYVQSNSDLIPAFGHSIVQ